MKDIEKNDNENNVLQNVVYVMKILFHEYPMTKWQVPLSVLCRVTSPFLGTLIPSVAIAYIMKGDVSQFILALSGVMLMKLLVDMIASYTGDMFAVDQVLVRVKRFMGDLIKKVLKTDYENVEPFKRQRMIEAATGAIYNGGTGAESLMREPMELLISCLGLFTYGAVIFLLDFKVMMITLVLVIADILFRIHAIYYSDRHRQENVEINRNRSYAIRSSLDIRAGKDIRVYEMEHWFCHVFDRIIKDAVKYEKKIHLRWYFPTLFFQVVIVPRDLIAYGILIAQALSGEISPAEFTLYLGLMANFSNWIFNIAEALVRISASSHVFNDYQKVLGMKDQFHHGSGEAVENPQLPIKIEFQDVSFRYEDAPADTLTHVSFIIQPGEKIALVGNNGAGKTTIVKLLCGLYHPTEGKILVNNQDITELDIDEYQALLSVVFQDTELLAFPIDLNISGKDENETDQKRVRDSLEKAGLWEKISRLEQKEKTHITQVLDDKGILLSGGESQKLLLARALYKGGSMLILDEPTAALDPIAESKMYQEYSEMTTGKTSVFISHRLASTKFCDKILFLENGRIIESGSHTELILCKGKYKEIFDIQSHYYQEKVVL